MTSAGRVLRYAYFKVNLHHFLVVCRIANYEIQIQHLILFRNSAFWGRPEHCNAREQCLAILQLGTSWFSIVLVRKGLMNRTKHDRGVFETIVRVTRVDWLMKQIIQTSLNLMKQPEYGGLIRQTKMNHLQFNSIKHMWVLLIHTFLGKNIDLLGTFLLWRFE